MLLLIISTIVILYWFILSIYIGYKIIKNIKNGLNTKSK